MKINECIVRSTYDDGTQSDKIMSIEQAMLHRHGVMQGATPDCKVEIFLKISEADSSHIPNKPGVLPSSAPPKHSFHKREDGLLHCYVCGGAEVTLPKECPGQKMTDKEAELVGSGKLNYINGKWILK